ncbi:hypothetical protein L209DRAFT_751404 [Thermothelomyces heterothallicus CBS 203.75]
MRALKQLSLSQTHDWGHGAAIVFGLQWVAACCPLSAAESHEVSGTEGDNKPSKTRLGLPTGFVCRGDSDSRDAKVKGVVRLMLARKFADIYRRTGKMVDYCFFS